MQPENGGVSVFTHEFGHDLGLPDHYDTNGGDNGVEFWNLMAQSRLNGKGEPLGTRAGDLSAWDKLQLGWLDYETVRAGQTRDPRARPARVQHRQGAGHRRRAAEEAGHHAARRAVRRDQAVLLRQRRRPVDRMTVPLDLAGKSGARPHQQDALLDRGGLRLPVRPDLDRRRQDLDQPATARSAASLREGRQRPARDHRHAPTGKWVDLSVPLTTLNGKQGLLRMLLPHRRRRLGRRRSSPTTWRVKAGGQRRSSSTTPRRPPRPSSTGSAWSASAVTNLYPNYYIASNRSYVSYDKYLKTGPVQLRLPGPAGLRRALQLPAGPAHQLLGHLAA